MEGVFCSPPEVEAACSVEVNLVGRKGISNSFLLAEDETAGNTGKVGSAIHGLEAAGFEEPCCRRHLAETELDEGPALLRQQIGQLQGERTIGIQAVATA